MSTGNEIRAVYDGDISWMTNDVVSRRGVLTLYEGLDSMNNVWPEEYMDFFESVIRADDITPAFSKANGGC